MGVLIVIEGLDGSGKATLTRQLTEAWQRAGKSVATLSFPRYGESVYADLVRDVLYNKVGDLGESVYGAALLFALDRRDAVGKIHELIDRNNVVLLDRYITSNAAYASARLGAPEVETDFPQWLRELEVDRFGEPLPDHQVLLATPTELAADRARGRAAADTDRALDSFEADRALQHRTAAMYERLAAEEYLSPWTVLRPEADGYVDIAPVLTLVN